jgi:non-specific serine/threonine protein kinase
MLEMVREYGAEQLVLAGSEDAARAAHAAYFLAFAETAGPALEGPDQSAWFNRIEAEVGNIRAALAWLQAHDRIEEALRLAGALAWFWTAPTYVAEGRERLESLLGLPVGVAAPVRAKALEAAGDLAHWQADTARATELQEEALALWRSVGDRRRIAATLRGLGSAAIDARAYERAEALLTEAQATAREVGDRWNAAAASNLLGLAAKEQGDWKRAVPLYEAAIRDWRELGDLAHVVAGLTSLAWAYLTGHDEERAWETADAAAALAAAAEDDVELALALAVFARLAAAAGALPAAVRLLAAATDLRASAGLPWRPTIQVDLHGWIANWESTLGSAAFSTAWVDGRALDREAALAEARTIPRPPPADQNRSAGLSPREIEVLRLLVEGASDPEIAERLFISRKTASNHVHAILAKLGVANRTAAATLAVRLGLA